MFKAKQLAIIPFLLYTLLAATGCRFFSGKNKNDRGKPVEIGKPLPPIELGAKPSFTFNGVAPATTTSYSNVTNLVISNQSFSNLNGDDLSLRNCNNILISNCYFGLAPSGDGIHLNDCKNVTIVDCFFANTGVGIWLTTCNGPIAIANNQFLNMNGKSSQFSIAHAVILDKCNGAGITVNRNYIESFWGENNINDQINLYQSNGTATDPIVVSNNIMRGGSSSNSGTGIIAGDGGNSSYENITGNVCVNTGAVGIATAGGHHITMKDNQVYGLQSAVSNVGMYIWNQYKSDCNNIAASGNKINWKKSDGSLNNFWNGAGNCSLQNWDATNTYGHSLASMHMPAYLFTIPVDTFWYIRKTGFPYTGYLDIPRPSSDAGSDQNIHSTSTNLDAGKSTSANGVNYYWAIARGPSGASIANPNAVSTIISGLSNGTYHIRLVVADNGNGHGTDTAYDVSWVDINVSGLKDATTAGPATHAAAEQVAAAQQHSPSLKSIRYALVNCLNNYAWLRMFQDKITAP